MKTLSTLFLAGALLGIVSCQKDTVTPNFPTTRAYYSFRVFKPSDPAQPRNEVGFDTLTYRAEDGTTRILTNRTLYYEVDYDTTIYANVPADRGLEGYLSARKAQSVSIEVGLLDKLGAKQKLDYRLANRVQSQTFLQIRTKKEVELIDIENALK